MTAKHQRTLRARNRAHKAFDPLWQEKRKKGRNMCRTAAYYRLAKALGIHHTKCHFSMFDERTCQKVIELCAQNKL